MERGYNPNNITRYNISCLVQDEQGILSFGKKFKSALVLNDRKSEFLRKTITPILFLDSYKLLLYKLHNGLAVPFETQLFSVYQEIENTRQLENLYYNMEEYLVYSATATSFFSSIPYLGKISIFKEISEYDNEILEKVTGIHSNDLEEYDIEIDEDFIFDYHVEKYKYLLDNGVVAQPIAIGTEIAGLIRKIAMKNPKNMFELISRMNKTVFDNLDDLIKDKPEAKNYLQKCAMEYSLDEGKFNTDALYDGTLLLETIGLYCKVRDIQRDFKPSSKELKLTNDDEGKGNE